MLFKLLDDGATTAGLLVQNDHLKSQRLHKTRNRFSGFAVMAMNDKNTTRVFFLFGYGVTTDTRSGLACHVRGKVSLERNEYLAYHVLQVGRNFRAVVVE